MNEWDLLRGFSKAMLLIGLTSATVIGIGYLARFIIEFFR
jgi:hypothetical protein